MATEVPALAGTLSKLIGCGISAWTRAPGPEPIDDVGALRALVDAGLCMGVLRADEEGREIAVRQFVLIVRAFGEALNRHWYGGGQGDPREGLRERLSENEVGWARVAQIDRRLRTAGRAFEEAESMRASELAADAATALLGDPTRTPFYRRVFRAFFDPRAAKFDEDPLISERGRRSFERQFRLAYAEGITTEPGLPIRRFIAARTVDGARVVHDLRLRDMAAWGSAHVFGAAGERGELEPLPLAEMYVHGDALEEGADGITGPHSALERVEHLVESHRVVLVKAASGRGKSTLARMLAWRAARALIEDVRPATDVRPPIVIDCGLDFEGADDALDAIVRRALRRHARALDVGLNLDRDRDRDLDDDAFATTPGDALLLVDGLDVASLGEQAVKNFLRRICDSGSGHHAVIFAHPAGLPGRDDLGDIPVLELVPLGTTDADGVHGGQAGEWLRRYCRTVGRATTITMHDLAARGVVDPAMTPILLFMTAHAWDAPAGRAGSNDPCERFFRSVARAAAARGTRSPSVLDGENHLLARLREQRLLDASAEPADAVLWLMSWVAWKAKCAEDAARIEGHRAVLDVAIVREMLRNELRIESAGDGEGHDAALAIDVGLPLSLEAGEAPGSERVVFGHTAFRDLLAGRYWAQRLRRLIEQGNRRWEFEDEEPLLGGRLLGHDDETFRAVREQLAGWTAAERDELSRWAQRCFGDERPVRNPKGIRGDRRALLREAALAIGSTLGETSSIKAKDPRTLRSMLAWFWLHDEDAIVLAPRLQSPRGSLHGARLAGADLRGADLSFADLREANLSRADLRHANLTSANLGSANLRFADLREAILVDANLRFANLDGAKLDAGQHARAPSHDGETGS